MDPRARVAAQPATATHDADLSIDSDLTVIRPLGHLDMATAPDLLARVRTATSRRDMRTLVLDFAGVTFMDSTGLGTLVQIRNVCAEHDTQLKLRAVGENVRRVLDMTNMTSVFVLHGGDDIPR